MHPASSGEAEWIEFWNLAVDAVGELRDAGAERAIEESSRPDDEEFWRHQARSLGVFVTPAALRSFRLPNRLVSAVEVSDRFFVKPLLARGHVPAGRVRSWSPWDRSA